MTNEEKQALIERLNKLAENLKWHNVGYAQDVLAAVDALTAQPVKLPPRRYMLTRENIDMGYETCMAISVEDAIAAIRAAGYEVQE